jgi:chromate transporter
MAPLLELFVSFAKVGTFGYGGGPSMIPLIQAEVVGGNEWMTEAQFTEALAAGYALPGPIATKMAAYVGFHVAGVGGALASLLGVVLPSLILLAVLVGLLSRYAEHPRVIGMLKGVKPVVIAMLAWVVIELAFKLEGWDIGLALMAGASLTVLLLLQVHPAWLIAAGAIIGAIAYAPK